VFGAAEARTALLAWGADPDKASPAWVANHWKWVVWKLAAYDRKLMGDSSSSSSSCSSSGGGGGEAGGSSAWCLSAAGVMQQLQGRYTREVKEGERSVLKKVGAAAAAASTRLLTVSVCNLCVSASMMGASYQQQATHLLSQTLTVLCPAAALCTCTSDP
jgi:breast cancer 2 susceptibility protein